MADLPHSITQINWFSVREKIASALSATEAAAVPSSEHSRQILTERARALAVPAQEESSDEDTIDAVAFRLSRERYAIETRYVREVIPLQEITPLPQTAGFIAGIIILRGELLPVFDLRTFFSIAPDADHPPSHLLIGGESQGELAILVCGLPQAAYISATALSAIAEQRTGDARPLLRGVTGDALTVIDGFSLVTDHRFFVG